MSCFNILLYQTSTKRKIILEFIHSFSDLVITKIHNDLDFLEKYGLKLLRTPLVKKIHRQPSLYELRIKTKAEIRLLFYFSKPRTFIILHGFVKKTNKLPIKDLKIALKRVREFMV